MQPILTCTTAPVDYDGFGTQTVLARFGKDRDKTIRLVSTPAEHVDWQRSRYASGLHQACGLSDFLLKWAKGGLYEVASMEPIVEVLAETVNALKGLEQASKDDPQFYGPDRQPCIELSLARSATAKAVA